MRNLSLIKSAVMGSICGTTTVNGHRTRKTCGFFIPQIPFNGYEPTAHTLSFIEFVARSIRRNKAEYIRTNKASRLTAVVEALSHLLQVGKSFTNTVKRSFKMKTFQTPSGNPAQNAPIVFDFQQMEGIYA
ncbi:MULTISPECIES: hypothetical protein [Pasteurellaceae]|uniref:hypothetical protein n=1 Tax=Pasteurellaceae TaxID=712 RepID=UPI0035676652